MRCKYCGEKIKYFYEGLWHDESKIFPQYCRSKYNTNGDLANSVLHEPLLKEE